LWTYLAARPTQARIVATLLPMFLFVLWHDERFFFIHSDEKWAYYFPVRWLVLPHVLGGMIALRSALFSSRRAFVNDTCGYTASWAVYILPVSR
jgi:hypothetical protein